ncbi:MAG: GldG family protein [Anaerolineales bacterium]|nr:GldG family protein [Anaerolineales bacterium]
MPLPKHWLRRMAVLGALALLAALIIYLAEDELNTVVFVLLVAGVVGVGAWMLLAPDELRDWLTGRQVYYGTGTAILTIIVIGFAVAGYSLAEQQNLVRDLTDAQIYTLDKTSVRALEQMESRLAFGGFTARIVGFYNREELRERKSAEYLLQQYAEKSTGLLTLEFIDPDIEPLMAQQFGYSPTLDLGPLYLVIYNSSGNRVTIEPIGGPEEVLISTAMLRISVAGQFKVYFITGHLEYSAQSEAGLGLSGVYTTLPLVGINTDTLDITTAEAIPSDATTIIIAGAQLPYTDSDVEKIAAYMASGGRMLVLADPPYADPISMVSPNTFMLTDDPLNRYLWDEFGVRMREDLISDVSSSIENEFVIVPARIGPSAIMDDQLQSLAVYFTLVRSIEMADDLGALTSTQAAYRRDVIYATSDDAFGETRLRDVNLEDEASFDADSDTAGPLAFAVSIRLVNELDSDIQPRVIIIGDTDWLTNDFIDPQSGIEGIPGNIKLWNNTIEWLTRYSEIASIPAANRTDLLPIIVTNQEQTRIQLITLVLLPGAILAVGVLVWGFRRQA